MIYNLVPKEGNLLKTRIKRYRKVAFEVVAGVAMINTYMTNARIVDKMVRNKYQNLEKECAKLSSILSIRPRICSKKIKL